MKQVIALQTKHCSMLNKSAKDGAPILRFTMATALASVSMGRFT